MRLFDQPAQYNKLYSMNPDGTRDESIQPRETFVPREQGFLTTLGKTLSGVGAAFAGDTQWSQRQQQIEQAQYQADLEFRARMLMNQRQAQEDASQKQYRDMNMQLMAEQIRTMREQSLQNKPIQGPQLQPPLVENKVTPTLSDAITIKDPKTIVKQGVYGGKVSRQEILNPDYTKALEMKNFAIKDVKEFSDPLEKLASITDNLETAIRNTPDFGTGPGSKLKAQARLFAAEQNNEKWFTDYNTIFNQSFLPLAQASGQSKVLSDLDFTSQIKAIGESTLPKAAKLEALNKMKQNLASNLPAKLNALGVDVETYKKIYPKIGEKFLGGSSNTSASNDEWDKHSSGVEFKWKK
jgi:hypothetical protein